MVSIPTFEVSNHGKSHILMVEFQLQEVNVAKRPEISQISQISQHLPVQIPQVPAVSRPQRPHRPHRPDPAPMGQSGFVFDLDLKLGVVSFVCFSLPYMGMDQYLLIPFLREWPSIYQLFWCSPGVQGFDTLPNGRTGFMNEVLVSLVFFLFQKGEVVPKMANCPLSALLLLNLPSKMFFFTTRSDFSKGCASSLTKPTRKRFFVAWAAVCKDMRAYWRQRRNENSRRWLDSRSKAGKGPRAGWMVMAWYWSCWWFMG